MRHIFAFIAALLVLSPAAFAQTSPHSGEDQRSIKALTPQEVEDLLAGRGLEFARAAELNHYPGPAQVLELASQLKLTTEQRTRTETTFREMRVRAVRLGRELISEEAALDRLFAGGKIDRQQLKAALGKIAALRGEIRYVHLQAHLAQKEILTPDQVARYAELRGYRRDSDAAHAGRAPKP
jgi:Spy/CpxP family protein refolding chaperone